MIVLNAVLMLVIITIANAIVFLLYKNDQLQNDLTSLQLEIFNLKEQQLVEINNSVNNVTSFYSYVPYVLGTVVVISLFIYFRGGSLDASSVANLQVEKGVELTSATGQVIEESFKCTNDLINANLGKICETQVVHTDFLTKILCSLSPEAAAASRDVSAQVDEGMRFVSSLIGTGGLG